MLKAVVGVREACAPAVEADVVPLFAQDRASLESGLRDLLPRLRPGVVLWVAYPKLASHLAGDLSRDIIHAAMPARGLKTVSQIAIDEDWTALRLKPSF